MANIYQRANIRAGDPIGDVERGGDMASSYLHQYKHQSDILKEINEALGWTSKTQKSKASAASSKGLQNSLIYGLIAEGIMAAITAGASTAAGPGTVASWVSPLVGGGMQALGALETEKWADKHYDTTEKLRGLEKKFKGRKQVADIKRAKRLYDEADEQREMLNVGLGALFGGIGGAGDLSKAVTSWSTMDKAAKKELIKEGSEEAIKAAKDEVVKKATIQPRFLGIPFGKAADIAGKKGIQSSTLAETLGGLVGAEDLVSGASGLIDDIPFIEDLLKYSAGPAVVRAMSQPPVFDKFQRQGFQNPYGRRI